MLRVILLSLCESTWKLLPPKETALVGRPLESEVGFGEVVWLNASQWSCFLYKEGKRRACDSAFVP